MSEGFWIVQFLVVFGVLFNALVLGKRLFPRAGWAAATGMGAILFLGVQSMFQTVWFYAGGSLGRNSDVWCLVGATLACQAVVLFLPHADVRHWKLDIGSWKFRRVSLVAILTACSLASAGFVLVGASRVATQDAIRTPWPLLLPGTLAAVAFAWAAVALSAWLVRSRALTTLLAAIALFATTGIAPLLYRLGFGFDGFLHVAAEKLILSNGTLSPKPFYYIGQYVFTTWLSRIADIPIESIDRWLVPVALAILIPLSLYLAQDKKDDSTILPFVLFLLPLAPFVATTPQSFAYVLGLSALFLAFQTFDFRLSTTAAPLILALWSVAVHPLAGLPIFFVVLALSLPRLEIGYWILEIGNFLRGLCIIASATIIPLLFFIIGRTGATPIAWNLSSIFNGKPWIDLVAQFVPWIGNRFVVWPAWASLVDRALPFFLLVAAIGSIRLTSKDERRPYLILLASALLLFVSATLLKTAGDFAFLIDYERGNYADRLNLLAQFCLLPAAMPSVAWMVDRARRHVLLGAAIFAGCLAIASAMTYNALPRNDALVVGHGWSVGRADIEAVRAIDRDAAGQPYTVLADQSVSAAAVSQFGFKRYHGDVFFYPIPTGGPLYDVFLRMTYQEPSRDTAHDAARLGGSDLVYVVLNDYWWNADRLAESLSAIANQSWTFGDATAGSGHAVSVYKFDLKK